MNKFIDNASNIAIIALTASASILMVAASGLVFKNWKIQDARRVQILADANRQAALARKYDAKAVAEAINTLQNNIQ